MADGGAQPNLSQLESDFEDAHNDWLDARKGGREEATVNELKQDMDAKSAAFQQAKQAARSPEEVQRQQQLQEDMSRSLRSKMNDPNALSPSNNAQGSDGSSGPGGKQLPEGSKPMSDGDLPGGTTSEAGGKQSAGGDSDGAGSGSQDPVAIQREKLRNDTAQAAMAKLAGESSAADMDIDGQINKQTSRLNHWMLEAEIDGLIDSDISTCGLSLIVTLPTRIVFCGVLALELKHAVLGSKSMIPYFPTLTWESFMPPGTEISIPAPTFLLWLAVVAYLITVILATLVIAAIIGIIYGATIGGAIAGFEFLTDLFAS